MALFPQADDGHTAGQPGYLGDQVTVRRDGPESVGGAPAVPGGGGVDGGGRGLFAGIVPTYLKVMPATAIGAPPHHLRHYWSTLDLQCGVASGLTAVH